jgi:hypothetical protein
LEIRFALTGAEADGDREEIQVLQRELGTLQAQR